jgi:general secretion pathway protein D
MRPSEGHLHVATPAPAPAASIPSPVQALPILPPPKPIAAPETYSVVVNNVRVQDLLFALARDAKLNVDISPGLSGNVTLNAIDQTLPQLLSRIAKQVDMRYEFDGPNLTVMPDTPYLHVYQIDYVNMGRETEGKISASGQITGQTTGSSNPNNSSVVTITNKSSNNFWVRLEQNVKDILQQTDKIITPPVVLPTAQPVSALAKVEAAITPPQNAAPMVALAPTVTYREASSVIANPEAGVLSVRATSRQHEKIQQFLDQVLVNVKRQVLIEATIVEVQLSNDYQQGIDWAVLSGSAGLQLLQGGLYRNADITKGPVFGQLPIPSVGDLTAAPTANLLSAQYNSKDFKATIQLLETSGNVRVLSSPRVSVINNQTAVLKVVDNLVYFNVNAQTSQSQSSSLTTFTTTPQTVSVGFIMNVTPQISDDGTVLLNVKPTIRRLISYVNDPNPDLARNNIINRVPQIREREVESVLKLASGQIGVMGGLIQDELQDNADTIPGVNHIPFFGDLFANKNIQNNKSELVIFMRPIVVSDPSVQGDYHEYSSYLPGPGFMSQPHPTKPAAMDGGTYR